MDYRSFAYGVVLGGLLGLIPGFGLGVYFLPVLIAEDGASAEEIMRVQSAVDPTQVRRGVFRRDLPGSDALHWGEGEILLSQEQDGAYMTLIGEVSPGPDYRLYLTPQFVDTEADFLAIKDESVQVAQVKAFKNFRYQVPASVNADGYGSALIWCERFEQFITAATLE